MKPADLAKGVLDLLERRGMTPATVRFRLAQGEPLEGLLDEVGVPLEGVGLHRPHALAYASFHIFPGL